METLFFLFWFLVFGLIAALFTIVGIGVIISVLKGNFFR